MQLARMRSPVLNRLLSTVITGPFFGGTATKRNIMLDCCSNGMYYRSVAYADKLYPFEKKKKMNQLREMVYRIDDGSASKSILGILGKKTTSIRHRNEADLGLRQLFDEPSPLTGNALVVEHDS